MMGEKQTKSPPKCFLRFFRWYCHPGMLDYIEGDLLEVYERRVKQIGKRSADMKFIIDVLLLFRPAIIRPAEVDLYNLGMIQSYFKIGWRSLWKSKGFTLVSLSGMIIGMTCFMLIALFIQYELSYDKQHENADRIFRISQIQKGNEFRGSDRFALAPMPLAPALKEKFPEVEAATNLSVETARFSHNSEAFYEVGLFSDQHLFEVFTFPMLEGKGKESLSDPNTIILTESLAKKYFGDESPIGKTLEFESERLLTVTGVTSNVPENEHLYFQYITSYKNLPWFDESQDNWASNNYRAYIVLQDGFDYKDLEKKLSVFDREVEEAYSKFPFKAQFFLQPLLDIHLYSQLNFEIKANGDIKNIYLAASIAYIILLLALINYMNLAIVQFNLRWKEVGIRKVMGAERKQLVFQFLTEAFLITIFSFVAGIAISNALLPQFNELLDLKIPYNLGANRFVFISLLGSAIILGGLSGLYPAIYSSLVSPANSLKGKWHGSGKHGVILKNSLVVAQLMSAIILVIGCIVVLNQLQFIQTKKLGFERDQIIYIPYQQVQFFDETSTLTNELLKNQNILNVSVGSNLPLNSGNQGIATSWEGNTEGNELYIYRSRIDHNYIDLFQIEIAAGRNFSPAFPIDSLESYILNEAAVKALGWEPAIGKSFEGGTVVGVVEDFHFQPFNFNIEPMFMKFRNRENSLYGNIILKIDMDEREQTLAYVKKTLSDLVPEIPFNYHYLDDSYNEMYKTEKRFSWIINIFTFIALFISVIGLLGLINQNVVQRIKEIGIRKVLGASVVNILTLLSRGFFKLVLVSIVVASPIAYYLSSKWLERFAYKIELAWWIFVAAGLLTAFATMIAIGFQATKAALMNPIASLKSE